MDTTPNLDLPYIMGAQAQKHVTHNEAIRKLDALVQLTILDRDLTVPPATPADGDRYIVATGASGAWSGHDGEVAAFQDGAWAFYAPAEGWLAWIADETALVSWDGSVWIAAGGASTNPAPLVGVNTTADTTNRLAAKSDAVLFSHDDVTPGTGDQRTILNKASTEKTASFLFQSNWSGRAEVGLVGGDDFAFKVSPDGGTWHEALLLKKDGSAVVPGAQVQHAKPPKLPPCTSGTLPSAATYGAGSLIYVSDWPGGGATLMSDGTRWRRVLPRTAAIADLLRGDEGIAIDFRAREARINDYTDALTAIGRPAEVVTLTRASDATFFGRNGVLETAGSNGLRFAYDPVTREPRGLLVEGAATNLYKQSRLASGWNPARCAITPNDAIGPDGTMGAARVTVDGSAGITHYLYQPGVPIAAGAKYCRSFFAKAGSGSGAGRRIATGTSFTPSANWIEGTSNIVHFDLASGAVVAGSGPIYTNGQYGMLPAGDGWYLCWTWMTAAITTTENSVILMADDAGSTIFSGNGSDHIFVDEIQFEEGTQPSSRIRTTTATASRAADRLTIGPDTFPVLASGEATLYWRGRIRQLCESGDGQLFSASDNTSDEVIALREGASLGGIGVTVVDGGSAVADTASHAAVDDVAVAVGVQPYGLLLYADGSAVETDWSMTAPTIDRLTIAPGAGSAYEINEIAYIARALTAAELAALTTV
jgi:hypothetical protein